MCGLWGSCGPAGSVPPSSPCSAGPNCGPVCSWESEQPASPDTETGCTQSPDRKNTNIHEDTQNKTKTPGINMLMICTCWLDGHNWEYEESPSELKLILYHDNLPQNLPPYQAFKYHIQEMFHEQCKHFKTGKLIVFIFVSLSIYFLLFWPVLSSKTTRFILKDVLGKR